jgi:hypothetical protein
MHSVPYLEVERLAFHRVRRRISQEESFGTDGTSKWHEAKLSPTVTPLWGQLKLRSC